MGKNDLITTVIESKKPALFVIPHPDDEAIGCSVAIERIKRVLTPILVYLTTGVPQKRYTTDNIIKTFGGYNQYAMIRNEEYQKSIKILNVKSIRFQYASRTLMHNIEIIYKNLRNLIETNNIQWVFCPPYEGGHPDHDVANCIVAMLNKKKQFTSIEYALYHMRNNIEYYQSFRPSNEIEEYLQISEYEKKIKNECILRYASQYELILNKFSPSIEVFRKMPVYDYSMPPDEKKSYYEMWDSGIDSKSVTRLCRKFVKTI